MILKEISLEKSNNIIPLNEYKEKYYDKLISYLNGNNLSLSEEEKVISLETFFDTINDIYSIINYYIDKLFTSIIVIKYCKLVDDINVTKDTGIILSIFDSILYLQTFKGIITESDLKDIYNNIINSQIYEVYSKYAKQYELDEDFSLDHLYDIDYHLNNIKQYSNDKIFLNYIEELLKRKGYR